MPWRTPLPFLPFFFPVLAGPAAEAARASVYNYLRSSMPAIYSKQCMFDVLSCTPISEIKPDFASVTPRIILRIAELLLTSAMSL